LDTECNLGNHAEDSIFIDKDVFNTVDFDCRTAVLREKDFIAFFDIERNGFAIVILLASAQGDDFRLLRFFFSRIRNNDSATDLFIFLNALQ